MKEKSMQFNAAINGVKTVFSLVFPLITFPYISRVLQVENVGKVNFATSIISYFILIAGLGIQSYAIREGSRIKDNKSKLEEFSCQVFTINVISTIISYILLFVIMAFTNSFNNYKALILVQSINIIGTTIGVNWYYNITESYLYTTIRTIVFQVLAVLLMFIVIKSEDDFLKYAWILVLSTSGANVLNYIHSKRYINIRIIHKIQLKRHIKPIFYLFVTTIAITIYVNIDITMLGLMTDDYSVGLYSTSVKIYTIIKNIIASVLVVALPRLSFYVAKSKEVEYRMTLSKINSYLIILVVPIIIGLNLITKQIIYLMAGASYLESTTSLHILSFSIAFSAIATYFTSAILLPLGKEKIILVSTLVSAGVNIVLNIFFIPLMRENGAAITTLISEIMVCAIELAFVKNYIKIKIKELLDVVIGSLAIIFAYYVISSFELGIIMFTVITVVVCCLTYFIVLRLLKNEVICEMELAIRKKIVR